MVRFVFLKDHGGRGWSGGGTDNIGGSEFSLLFPNLAGSFMKVET